MKTRHLIAVLGLSAVAATANAALWDLETLPAGTAPSVSQTADGITLTLTRQGGVAVQIQSIAGLTGVPASYGQRTLSPFNDTGATWFIGNFSGLVENISIDYGDFTPSDQDIMRLEAYGGLDGTGPLLASTTSPACCDVGSGFDARTIALAVTGVRSIRFIGGSTSFPNSLFYDNIRATGVRVPEPAMVTLLGLGLLGVALARRRKA